MELVVDRELKIIAAGLIRDMNKITGVTTAEQARRLEIHKGNVAACINQGQVQALGVKNINLLLRMYGFEFSDQKICIRDSEACPAFNPRPFTDEKKNGLIAVVNRLRSLRIYCSFCPFDQYSDLTGPDALGGILFAKDDNGRKWACIALSTSWHEDLVPFFEALKCPILESIPIRDEAIESWIESPPHRSELLRCWVEDSPNEEMPPDIQLLDPAG